MTWNDDEVVVWEHVVTVELFRMTASEDGNGFRFAWLEIDGEAILCEGFINDDSVLANGVNKIAVVVGVDEEHYVVDPCNEPWGVDVWIWLELWIVLGMW